MKFESGLICRVGCLAEDGGCVELDEFSPLSRAVRLSITSKMPIVRGSVSFGVSLDIERARLVRDGLTQWIEEQEKRRGG